jgi:hypothetical protein
VSSRASSEHTEREAEPDRAAQGSTEALHEVDRLLTLQRTVGNRAVNRLLARQGLLQRQQDAQAPPTVSAAELDSNIDDAIRDKDWGRVALNLNGFNDTDLTARVSSDRRLRRHRREIMEGALRTMIRWPPPQRVAGAILVVDGRSGTARPDGLRQGCDRRWRLGGRRDRA